MDVNYAGQIINPSDIPPDNKRNKLVIIINILLVLFFIAIGLFYLKTRNREKVDNTINSTAKLAERSPYVSAVVKPIYTLPDMHYYQDGNFIIKDSQVVFTRNGKNEVLFTDVPVTVKQIRLGPDGVTLHFRDTGNKSKCADLETTIKGVTTYRGGFKPGQPPWSYEKIGHANVIDSCDSGYIKGDNKFIYITHDITEKKYWLTLVDGDNNQISKNLLYDSS